MSIRSDASTEGLIRTTSLPASTAFTIAGWFMNRGTGDGSWETIFSMQSSGGGIWQILYKRMYDSAAVTLHGSAGDVGVGITLSNDTWYYAAFGSNGSGANALTGWIITVDGTVYTASTTGNDFPPGEISALRNTTWTEWCNGRLANVMVWSTKLTQAELLAQMRSLRPIVQEANLHLWTPLWGPSDLLDYSGNARNWTSAGGTLTQEDHPPVAWGAPIIALPPLAEASGVVISCGVGTLAIAGPLALVVPGGVIIGCGAGTLVITGPQCSVQSSIDIPVSAAPLTIQGNQATVVAGEASVVCTPGVLTCTGPSLTVFSEVSIACSVGSLLIQGHSLTVQSEVFVGCSTASLLLQGLGASVLLGGVSVACALGSLVVNGHQATVDSGGATIQCTYATLSISGIGGVVVPGEVSIACALGALSIVGIQSTVLTGIIVTCIQAQMSLIGLQSTILPGVVQVSVAVGGLTIAAHQTQVLSEYFVTTTIGSLVIQEEPLVVVAGGVTVPINSANLSLLGFPVFVGVPDVYKIVHLYTKYRSVELSVSERPLGFSTKDRSISMEVPRE